MSVQALVAQASVAEALAKALAKAWAAQASVVTESAAQALLELVLDMELYWCPFHMDWLRLGADPYYRMMIFHQDRLLLVLPKGR